MKFLKKYWILILIAAITLAAILVYVFRCKLFPALASCVPDPNLSNTPVPQGSPTPKWVPETFPLNVGMFGSKIKSLQTALGISADGKFGPQTKAAVIAKGKSVPLTQVGYDDIINPPTVCLTRPKLSSAEWIVGRPVYALFARAIKTSADDDIRCCSDGTDDEKCFFHSVYPFPKGRGQMFTPPLKGEDGF